MTLAARTRAAVRSNPFLYDALRADVVNYTAAARYLDLGAEDREAVVAALRRYADDLAAYDATGRSARVSMESGLGATDPASAMLAVGETAFGPDGGDQTAILATGDVDARSLAHALVALDAEGVTVTAAGYGGETFVVLVSRRAGADALRAVESSLETVPES
jgi:hypothetical protein